MNKRIKKKHIKRELAKLRGFNDHIWLDETIAESETKFPPYASHWPTNPHMYMKMVNN